MNKPLPPIELDGPYISRRQQRRAVLAWVCACALAVLATCVLIATNTPAVLP